MSEGKITVLDKGPLLVKGAVVVTDAEGNRFETQEQFALCRCGQSKNKPFCDGAHSGAGFSDCVRAAKVL
jgi:CDGSH-type Zn-finger protein